MRNEHIWGQAGVLVDTAYLPLLPELQKYIPPRQPAITTPYTTSALRAECSALASCSGDRSLVPWWLTGETRNRSPPVQQRAAFLR